MSDTITITPEERAEWRKVLFEGTSSVDGCGMFYRITPRLLDALEQAEARLNDCGEDLKRAAALAEQAEANVERLTKERDWLADKCAMHCHDKDRDDILCSDDACDVSSLTCVGASACDWIEAARRAVAAGEG